MGMNCAVMSYDGKLFVGFTGDAQAIPDISSLPAFFTESFAELRDAVGIRMPTTKPPRRKQKIAIVKSRKTAVHEVTSSISAKSTGDAAFRNEAIPSESPAETVSVN